MNIETLKAKPLAVLAVILLLVVPTSLAMTTIVKATSGAPVLSVVLSRTTSTTMIPVQPIGTTFSVDVRVDSTGGFTPGINSYSYGLTWNPAVLNVTHVNDAFSGSFLNSGANEGTVQKLGDLPADNVHGLLVIGDILLNQSYPGAYATGSGVLTTVTFKVMAPLESDITLQPSDAGVAYLTYPDRSANSYNVIGTTTLNAQYNSVTSISLCNSGTINSTIAFPYGVNPFNKNISADLYINNPLAQNIWGWNLGVTWNPAVLQLKTVTEGPYMNPMSTTTLFIVGDINNKLGTIQGGISDIYLSNTTANAPVGVLATLTFKLLSIGNSNIALTAGLPTLANNHQKPIACQLTGATYKTLRLVGDVFGNGTVNVLDLIATSTVFGTQLGQSKYNPTADINQDGQINILDLILCATHLGQHWS